MCYCSLFIELFSILSCDSSIRFHINFKLEYRTKIQKVFREFILLNCKKIKYIALVALFLNINVFSMKLELKEAYAIYIVCSPFDFE